MAEGDPCMVCDTLYLPGHDGTRLLCDSCFQDPEHLERCRFCPGCDILFFSASGKSTHCPDCRDITPKLTKPKVQSDKVSGDSCMVCNSLYLPGHDGTRLLCDLCLQDPANVDRCRFCPGCDLLFFSASGQSTHCPECRDSAPKPIKPKARSAMAEGDPCMVCDTPYLPGHDGTRLLCDPCLQDPANVGRCRSCPGCELLFFSASGQSTHCPDCRDLPKRSIRASPASNGILRNIIANSSRKSKIEESSTKRPAEKRQRLIAFEEEAEDEESDSNIDNCLVCGQIGKLVCWYVNFEL